jgi:hypothetical protein
MSRPQKKHRPIKGDFNAILGAIAIGSGAGKKAATKLAKGKRAKIAPIAPPIPPPKP